MTDHVGGSVRPYVPQVKGRIELRKPKTPYLGSVRFFKHMIIGVALLLMIVPWVFVVNATASGRVARAETQQLDGLLIALRDENQSMADAYEERLAQAATDLEEARAQRQRIETESDLLDFTSAYGHIHPELRVEGPAAYEDSTGVIYLTFDDGPGSSTRAVLDILKRYDIQATFFVVGYTINGREDILRRAVEEGHNIGVHSYSHVYRDIYSSVEAFFDDFALCSAKIEEVTGIKPNIFRFPGGSLNSFNETWGNTIISEMLSRGYRYYDWNVGSGDASLEATADSIYEAVIRQARANPYGVVLMHDGGGNRSHTVQALPMIIDRLRQEGYRFEKLTNQVRPTVFSTAGYSRG